MLIETCSKAQSLLEYVVLIGIVTAALVAMTPYLKRGVQGIVKVMADQIGAQNEADQSPDTNSGYLVNAFTAHRASTDKQLIERLNNKTYIYTDTSVKSDSSVTNLGFTNQIY